MLKKLLIFSYLIGNLVSLKAATDLVRISELPPTNSVTTNDLFAIVGQPFTTNARTYRILGYYVLESLIKPSVVTTNLYVTNIYSSNIFTTNIVINGTNGLQGFVTPYYLTYADATNHISNSGMFFVNSNTVSVPIILITASLQASGSGTNWASDLSISNYLHLPFLNSVIPQINSSGLFTNSPIYVVANTNIGFNSIMYWGPGTTNALYRNGIFLTYTNGSSSQYPGFEVLSGDGSTARFLAGGNLAVLRGNAGAGLFDSLTAGREVRWFSDHFSPLQTSSSLGALDSAGPYQWNHVSTKTNFVNGFITTVSTNYSRLAISHTGTNGTILLDSQSSGIAGNPRPTALTFGGTNLFQFSPEGVMTWGPGATNVLYRSGANLVYTNGTAGPGFRIYNGSGLYAQLSVESLGGATVLGQLSQPIALSDGNLGVRFQDTHFDPTSNSAVSLGVSTGNFWSDLFLSSAAYVYGYRQGLGASSTNYSRLAVSHGGTNSSIILDSQGTGIAGTPRDLLIQSNGVTIAKIAMNSGYTGTGTKVMTDNGTFQTLGSFGSGGNIGDFAETIITATGTTNSPGADPTATTYALQNVNGTPLSLTLTNAGTYEITAYISSYQPASFNDYYKFRNTTDASDVSGEYLGNAVDLNNLYFITMKKFVTTTSGNKVIAVYSKSDDATYGSHYLAGTQWITALRVK